MFKHFFFYFLLLNISLAYAQESLDISLFPEDDAPLLGRTAEPLDSIRITPPPAPDLRIDLGKTQKEKSSTPPQSPSPPPLTNKQKIVSSVPSVPIDISPDTSSPTLKEQQDKNHSGTESPRVYKDPSIFDIAGFELGIPAYRILQQAKSKGYRITFTQEKVPLFFSTDYAYQCRQNGYVTPSQVSRCIQDMACQHKTRYISEAHLKRNNEVIQLFFTSNATENLLYKIIYINKGDDSLNSTRINLAKKKLRYKEFWNAVFNKYGNPDNEQDFVWGNEEIAYMKAYMTGSAYDGYLILEDFRLSGEDYVEALDIENERNPRNTFSF